MADYPLIIGGRYQLIGGPVAIEWNAQLAELFPNADHHGCRQQMYVDETGHWSPYAPARCIGYHCPKCGAAVGMNGHTVCEASG